MKDVPGHSVHVCCGHDNDLIYKDQLFGMEEWDEASSDWRSIFFGCFSREDPGIGSDMESPGGASGNIRENYMGDADVLILLCGENTKNDGSVDMELSVAIRGDGKRRRIGILALNLPTIEGRQCRISLDGKNAYVEDRHGGCRPLGEMTEEQIEEAFPFLPEIIIENLKKNICISVVDWTDVCGDPARLRVLIEDAARCHGSGD